MAAFPETRVVVVIQTIGERSTHIVTEAFGDVVIDDRLARQGRQVEQRVVSAPRTEFVEQLRRPACRIDFPTIAMEVLQTAPGVLAGIVEQRLDETAHLKIDGLGAEVIDEHAVVAIAARAAVAELLRRHHVAEAQHGPGAFRHVPFEAPVAIHARGDVYPAMIAAAGEHRDFAVECNRLFGESRDHALNARHRCPAPGVFGRRQLPGKSARAGDCGFTPGQHLGGVLQRNPRSSAVGTRAHVQAELNAQTVRLGHCVADHLAPFRAHHTRSGRERRHGETVHRRSRSAIPQQRAADALALHLFEIAREFVLAQRGLQPPPEDARPRPGRGIREARGQIRVRGGGPGAPP